jgi:hypothetical protein
MDGGPKTDGQTGCAIHRIYDRAGLTERDGGWHVLKHSFGTHAALFGVNPWTLMRWMGHKRIDETMLYVNLADAHRRELPPNIVASGARETDPDRRIVAMLGCRGTLLAFRSRPKLVVMKTAEERMVGRTGFGPVTSTV